MKTGSVKASPKDEGIFDGAPLIPVLLTPLTIRKVTFRNRIGVSPMCQYCAVDGMADDWHLVHLGSRAAGGAGLVFVEATAVVPEGRISPGDLGLWEDRQMEPLSRIARFITRMGSVPGIQLAHAGRKASVAPPFRGGIGLRSSDDGGWPVVAPSPTAFAEGYAVPRELTREDLAGVRKAFAAAARRAVAAEFRFIELHAAHGYLLHQFLSPLVNRRTDEYGGKLENRMRLAVEVATEVRQVIPDAMPLFVRISATDWVGGGWDLSQSITLAHALKSAGVDLIDASSGGLIPGVKIPVAPGYQASFAGEIRKSTGLLTAAVGMITQAEQANTILTTCDADVVLLGKQMLREPYWALHAAEELGQEAPWPLQYGYAVKRKR